MTPPDEPQTIPDAIEPDKYTGKFKEFFFDRLKQEESRQIIKNIVKECVENREYIKTFKEYADEQINERVFQSIKYWASIILIPMVVTIITAIIFKKLGL